MLRLLWRDIKRFYSAVFKADASKFKLGFKQEELER